MKIQKLSNVLCPFTGIKKYLHHKEEVLMVNIVYTNSLSEQGVKTIKSSQFNKVIWKILSLKMSASFVYS